METIKCSLKIIQHYNGVIIILHYNGVIMYSYTVQCRISIKFHKMGLYNDIFVILRLVLGFDFKMFCIL